MTKDIAWTPDELILALNVYLTYGEVRADEGLVIDLSNLLRRLNDPNDYPVLIHFRNPREVASKVNSFARLDPGNGHFGLDVFGNLREDIWEEFAHSPMELSKEVARIDQSLAEIPASSETAVGDSTQTSDHEEEKEQIGSGEDSSGHFDRLLEAFRQRLIDQTRSNRLLNYKHSESSLTHIRLVDTGLNDLLRSINSNRLLEFIPLPQHEIEPEDEQTEEFKLAYESARFSDVDFLDKLKSLAQDGSDDPDSQAVLDRELKDRVRDQIGLPARPTRRTTSPSQIARANGIDPSYSLKFEAQIPQQPGLRQIQTLYLSDRMEAKLGKIRDTVRRSIEETGFNRLFLALGFLEWYDALHSDTPNYAPLLVITTTIDRQSSENRWRYFLKGDDEPLKENIALRIRMAKEDLDLPEFSASYSLEQYFATVQAAVAEKENWKVHTFATVGLFGFANIELWNDLDTNNWPETPLTANENVRNLFGSGNSSSAIFADDHDVDSPEISSQLPPLVLDADSSQLSVVIDAMEGKDLAIKGPPGTGKSQTIANLIAALMSRGKRVLFVSEKMAALEVVKSRLDDAELGEFVLELHSSKAHTRNLSASLAERMEIQSVTVDEPALEIKREQLESYKQKLSEYVQLLNSSAGASGKTIHEVLWASQNRTFIFDHTQYRNLVIENPERLGLLDLEQTKIALDQFEANAIEIESDHGSVSKHPWNWVGKSVDAVSRRQLVDQVSDWLDLYPELSELEQRLENTGIEHSLDTPQLQQSLIEWIDLIPSIGPDIRPSLLHYLSDRETNNSLRDFVGLLKTRDELIDSLQLLNSDTVAGTPNGVIHSHVDMPVAYLDWETFSGRVPEYAESLSEINECLNDLYEHASQLDKLINGLAPRITIEVPFQLISNLVEHLTAIPASINHKTSLVEISKTVLSIESQISNLRNFIVEGSTLSKLFGLNGSEQEIVSQHFPYFRGLLEAAALLETASDESLELRADRFLGAQVLLDLQELKTKAKAISENRHLLSGLFRIGSVSSTSDLVDSALTLRNAGRFARRLPKFNEAKKTWMRLSSGIDQNHVDNSKDRFGMASDLMAIVSSIDEENAFNADERLKQLAGESYRGLGTNFDDLIDTCVYMNEARGLAQTIYALIGESDFGLLVSEVLQHGSAMTVAGIKQWTHSGSLARMLQSLISLELSDQATLGEQIASLEAEHDWFHKFETLADSLGLAEDLTLAHLPEVLSAVQSYSDLTSQIEERKEDLRRIEENRYEFKEDREEILATLAFSDQVIESLGNHATWSTRPFFSESVGAAISELREIGEDLGNWMASERSLIQRIEPVFRREILEEYIQPPDRSFNSIKHKFEFSHASADTIGSWMRFIESSDDCLSKGLASYINNDDFSSGLKPSVAYDAIFWNSLAQQILRERPGLQRFAGQTQDNIRKQFSSLDRDILNLNQKLIAKKLVRDSQTGLTAGKRNGSRSTWTEMSLINVLIPQTRPRATIRDVLGRAGNSVQILKPCFMMSPNSVAQYLAPGGIEFDVLIIDEASQMRPEEAIGAVARSSRSIIVGDPMQLPPTSFFNRVDTLDEDLEEDVEDESILDLALSSFSPYRELRWHYRSRHHDLINFSNRHFYGDRLIVFPSPESVTGSELGVRYHKVETTYLGGGVNVEEAKQVATAAIMALKDTPDWSLGVVAVNKEQTDLIREEFDQMMLRDRQARLIWEGWESTLYPGFIKNLENVQGDERDRIIISTVYGPNQQGRVSNQFGPIVNRHGHRRLNVLFTRARRRVDLYSSMSSSDIRLDERSSPGLKALRGYLDYAATLRLDAGSYTDRQPDSEFEIYVADALRSEGYEVVPQVGVGRFFIDLGVRHASYPHGFLAGIECDGASYHSAKSAKDRDILRQEILEGLGWDIYRVWSTDWFNDARGETQKLVRYLNELKESKLAYMAQPRVELSVDNQIRDDSDGVVVEDLIEESEVGFEEIAEYDENPVDISPDPVNSISTGYSESTIALDIDSFNRAEEGDLRLTVQQARYELIDYREDVIARTHPLDPRSKGLLRKTMLESLLVQLPTTYEEFRRKIPDVYKEQTDRVQISRHLEHVLTVLGRVDVD